MKVQEVSRWDPAVVNAKLDLLRAAGTPMLRCYYVQNFGEVTEARCVIGHLLTDKEIKRVKAAGSNGQSVIVVDSLLGWNLEHEQIQFLSRLQNLNDYPCTAACEETQEQS